MLNDNPFLIMWLLTLPISLILSGMFTLGIENRLVSALATIISAAVLSVIFSGLFVLHLNNEIDKWNDGVCPKCGTEWRLMDIEKRHQDEHYYYICDNCKELIETTTYMKN